MILVDANLLVYAIDRDSPNHRAARHWLEQTLSGPEEVGLPWIVALAFLRLTTRSSVVRRPLAPEAALSFVDSWLALPNVSLVSPGERHWPIFRGLLQRVGTAGNLTSDTHLAALAIELGCPVYSTDEDFKRFPGVTHVNPLA